MSTHLDSDAVARLKRLRDYVGRVIEERTPLPADPRIALRWVLDEIGRELKYAESHPDNDDDLRHDRVRT